MIIDLDQPVKAWLLDVIENFGTLIENGNDPAVEITNGDIYMEIRLVKAEGLFDRFKMQGEVNMNIIRISKTEFEMEDGSTYPIEPPLEKELTLEEFKEMYGKTLEALRSCGIIGSDNTDPTGVD